MTDKLAGISGALYAFSLPPDILTALEPGTLLEQYYLKQQTSSHAAHIRDGDDSVDATLQDSRHKLATYQQANSNKVSQTTTPIPTTTSTSSSRGCATCNVLSFPSVVEQRSHFKSDWHRYNIKMRLLGPQANSKGAVSESQFNEMLESLTDSISGSGSESESDSDSSDSSTSPINAVTKLVQKNSLVDGRKTKAQDDDESGSRKAQGSPFMWYTMKSIEKGIQLGIYRAILPKYNRHQNQQSQVNISDIKDIQVTPLDPRLNSKNDVKATDIDPKSHTWTILMIGGGHFAGMVISLIPKYANKGSGRYERESIIVQRKTFHRYTTRRKQGGSQSANDNAKGNAKSAGAALRRYGEAALQEEIRDLLSSWAELIDQSDAIFIRASRPNRKILYGYDGAPIEQDDSRLRTIPFPTRRPTVSELERVFNELTQVKIMRISDEEVQNMYREVMEGEEKQAAKIKREEEKATEQKARSEAAAAAKQQHKRSASEEQRRDQWSKVMDMVRKNRVDALKGWVAKYGTEVEESKSIIGELPEWMESERRRGWSTFLHVASGADAGEVVEWFLTTMRADPTVKGGNGTTPYEVAASRATRNVFRRFRAAEEEAWDWDDARIPSALTEEQEAEQRSKGKERKARMREQTAVRRKEKEDIRRKEEEEKKIKKDKEDKEKYMSGALRTDGPQRLGGSGGGMNTAGMSDAARARLERERRARAAEARLGINR